MEFDKSFYWESAKSGTRIYDNFAWFCRDVDGEIAVFFSGGVGGIPVEAFMHHDAYFDYYLVTYGEQVSNEDYCSAGFYVYSYEQNSCYQAGSPYVRKCCPKAGSPAPRFDPLVVLESQALSFANMHSVVVEDCFPQLNI